MFTRLLLLTYFVTMLWTALLNAQPAADQSHLVDGSGFVSQVRGIRHQHARRTRLPTSSLATDNAHYRSIDGTGNNLNDPEMGASHTPLRRLLQPSYTDGLSAMSGIIRKSPREISNIVSAQSGTTRNRKGASDYLWQWGQFLDHDISLTDGADPVEPAPIVVPPNDRYFTPSSTIAFNRSIYDRSSPYLGRREQINEITAWIDGSMVYGTDEERARALRTLDGSGRLRTSDGNLPPFNFDGLPNAGGNHANLFLAGDVRANEQVGLTALHIVFVREHNRLVAGLAEEHSQWDGEQLYQRARRLVGAQIQAITYNEFLPVLLGPGALPSYRGYRPNVDARVSNAFSTALFRFGHSALNSALLRLDASGRPIPYGHLALRDAFFNPAKITEEGGIEPLLRGLAKQVCQDIDLLIVDDVRNFLFGHPRAGGFDLAALNIQRGRDHGLPDYNAARRSLGLRVARDFADISSNQRVQAKLAQSYRSVEDIDLWVGALAEDPVREALIGEVSHRVLVTQFEALRDGDRHWHQRTLRQPELRLVERSTLAAIIRRNTQIGTELQAQVFLAR
jgi:peroxidase